MSQDFRGWLQYKKNRCNSNYRLQAARRDRSEITVEQYCDNVNKYEPPLIDIYETLVTIPTFPWNGTYSDMKQCLSSANIQDRGSIDDIIRLTGSAIILFEQYKLGRRTRCYKLDVIRPWTPMDVTGFNDFKNTIITGLTDNVVYTRDQLMQLYM